MKGIMTPIRTPCLLKEEIFSHQDVLSLLLGIHFLFSISSKIYFFFSGMIKFCSSYTNVIKQTI